MKILILVILSSLIFSCASYQSGSYADIVSGEHPDDTPITGYIDKTYTTNYYTLLQFTFGNGSPDWKRVKTVSLDFGSEELNKKVKVTLGKDLEFWAESIKHKITVDQFNTQVFLGSIAAAGTMVAISGTQNGSSSNLKAGALTYTTSLSIDAANDFSNIKDNVERANILPSGHLYKPFAIPAGLITKRWLLLEIEEEKMPHEIYISVTWKNEKQARYKIQVANKPFE